MIRTLIVGAGPTGLAAATELARNGYPVEIRLMVDSGELR